MEKKTNNNLKTIKIGILVLLVGSFLVFTVHKIYISDPFLYAKQNDFTKMVEEAKIDRNRNNVLAVANKEAIIEIRSNFNWIKTNQLDLKKQSEQILKTLEEIRKDGRK